MYTYKVKKILKIYDGDTITVEIDLGFGVYKKEKIRLAFINAPEIRGEERFEGLKSRAWLEDQLLAATRDGKDIIIRTLKDRKGKYGRYIGEIYIDDVSINHKMIEEGFAVAY
jgi:micrococcal nuclease